MSNMEMMHSMCQFEIGQLQQNLEAFLHESLRLQHLLRSIESNPNEPSVFEMLILDRYMSKVSTVVNLTRKFNLHLKLHGLEKVLDGASGADFTAEGFYKDFMQLSALQKETEGVDFKPLKIKVEAAAEQVIKEEPDFKAPSPTPHPTTQTTPPALPARKVRFDSYVDTVTLPIALRSLTGFVEGCSFKAAITYIEDYSRLVFYVRQGGNKDVLELSKMFHLPRYHQPPQGDEIFGFSIDNDNILRALLLSEDADSLGTCKSVLLVDFGKKVPLANNYQLYRLPQKYRNLPADAIKCILVGISDYEGKDCEYDTDIFAAILNQYKTKQTEFTVVRKSGHILYLRLHLSSAAPISLQKTRKAPETTHQHEKPRQEYEEVNARDYKEQEINANHHNEVGNPFLDPSDAKPSGKRVENLPRSNTLQDENFAAKGPTYEHANSIPTAETTPQSKPLRKKITYAEQQDDDVINIIVTHIAGVDSFYAQIEKEINHHIVPLYRSDDELDENQKLMSPPYVNDIVLAQYSLDSFWYRAKVKAVDEERDCYKMFYVDFGNEETVSLDMLAKCKLRDLDVPFRAVRCRIAGIRDITDDDDMRYQAVQTLVVVLQNQTVTVKVLQRTDKEMLIHFHDDLYTDLPSMLISNGYATAIN